MDTRRMDEPVELFEAMFEIYNLASVIGNDGSPHDSSRAPRILKLKQDITTVYKDTFTGTTKLRNDANDEQARPK